MTTRLTFATVRPRGTVTTPTRSVLDHLSAHLGAYEVIGVPPA